MKLALREHGRALAFVAASYVVAVALFRPFANVLYGADDWAYAWSVRHLLETGEIRASAWVTAAALPQTLWGAAFGGVFGLGPRTLNFATFVASLFGLAALYATGIRLRFGAKASALIAAFVAVTPHYTAYAFSFMSDMYYTALLLVAVLLLVTSVERRALVPAVVGGFFAALGFLNRQIGICVPLAFAGALALGALRRRADVRANAVLLVAGVALPCLTLVVYQLFPDWLGGRTIAQESNFSRLGRRLGNVELTAANLHSTLLYVAVLSLPFVLVWLVAAREAAVALFKRRRSLVLALAAASFAITLLRLVLGATLVVRGEFFHTEKYGAAPLAFERSTWRFLCCVASVSLPFLVVAVGERLVSLWKRASRELESTFFLALCFAAHVALTSSFVTYYNNYFLPLVPLAVLLVAASLEPKAGFPRAFSLAALGATALAAGVVNDAHFRTVEAIERTTLELEAKGTPSELVFGNPSSWAFRHYAEAEADLYRHRKRGLFAIFNRVREQARYWLAVPGVAPPKNKRLDGTRKYSTLLGTSVLNVWVMDEQQPAHERLSEKP